MKQKNKIKKSMIIALLLIIPCLLTAQVFSYMHPYNYSTFTTQQIKDTIVKYSDVFTAFYKLDSIRHSSPKDDLAIRYKFPSYDSIRNDQELKKSLLGLLDMNAYKEHLLEEKKKEFENKINRKDFDSIKLVETYLGRTICEKCNSKEFKKLTDSITSNKNIFKTHFDSAVSYHFKIEKSYYDKYVMNGWENFVDFLYPTQWQEVINFVKNNCNSMDKQGMLGYCNRILIEMNDKEAIDKFDKYFTEKLNTGKLGYYDYIFVFNMYINQDFKTKMYLKILQCPIVYYIDPFGAYITMDKDDDSPPLKDDVFNELISYPLDEKDFTTKGKPDYEKVIQYFKNKN